MQVVPLEDLSAESFRPYVISQPQNLLERLTYVLRLAVDTPHRSLISGIKPILSTFHGKVLDVGAGSQFYKHYVPGDAQYRALELKSKGDLFGWENSSIDYYDGNTMPYEVNQFDNVMCLEVLEHCEDYDLTLNEIYRVLKPGGKLLLSVPFAAKWHYVPHDYWRFTPSGLKTILDRSSSDFKIEKIYRRGGDLSVAFHTLTSSLIGLLFRKSWRAKLVGLVLSPIALVSGLMANLSEYLDLGAGENTHGYVSLLSKGESS